MTDRLNPGSSNRGTAGGRHRTGDTGDLRSDATLTAAIREHGDPGASEELYLRHAPAVLAYARACCRDPHTAEDLASEAFARTVQAVRDGRGPTEAWRPYLLAVVRHTAADWADRARRVDLAPGFEAWQDATAGSGGPDRVSREAGGEERVLRAEDDNLIAAAFRSLPERWRAVLWHGVVEEEPTARVGTLLGLTPSGVASLTARAREGLREAYLAVHAEQGAADEECRRCSSRLAAAVRRSRPRRDVHLDRHLERCARCRRAAGELTDLNQRLRTVLPVAVLPAGPAYLEARAAAASATVGAQAGASGSAAGGVTAGAKALVLAVAVTAVLSGGWALWPDGGEARDRSAAVPGAGSPSAAPQASPTSPASAAPSPSTTPSPSPSRPGASPSPSPATALPGTLGGPSTLRFVSTEGCMEIPGGTAEAGVRPVEAACDGGPAQRWALLDPYPGDTSRTQVRNEATGLCLARSGGTEDHAPVGQQNCDAARGTQLWNLWTAPEKGEMALRDADGSRYLGLVEWARADKDEEHRPAIGTTRYYYGSASMRFLFEPELLER